MRRFSFFSIVLLLTSIYVHGQLTKTGLEEPEVGKPCPNISFDKIDFYSRKVVSLDDFRGKWLVLDFWSIHCTACIGSFSEISEEQKAFKDSVQFIMVAGSEGEYERTLYANYHKKMKLTMPGAFDSALFGQFNVGSLPHTIIVDPHGIVKAITLAPKESRLRELIDRNHSEFAEATFASDAKGHRRSTYDHDERNAFLVNGNAGLDSNFKFRSLLANWTPYTPVYSDGKLDYSKAEEEGRNGPLFKGRFELVGVGIDVLYFAAYTGKTNIAKEDSLWYGKMWSSPIFETKERNFLQFDYVTGKNLYCYSLVVPPQNARGHFMMKIMQDDLKHYFGYEVFTETRKMPYWKLVATDDAKIRLKTKGGKESMSANGRPWQENDMRNCSMNDLIRLIFLYANLYSTRVPLLDETGIEGNIDIDLEWQMNNLDSVLESLRKNGLNLVKGEKEMKVLVIRDAKDNCMYP